MDDNSHLFNSLFWKNYNYVYSETYNKYYFACHKKCKVCKEWHNQYQLWKYRVFMPVHCFHCNYAGYPDDFRFYKKIVICETCELKIKNKIKNIQHLSKIHKNNF